SAVARNNRPNSKRRGDARKPSRSTVTGARKNAKTRPTIGSKLWPTKTTPSIDRLSLCRSAAVSIRTCSSGIQGAVLIAHETFRPASSVPLLPRRHFGQAERTESGGVSTAALAPCPLKEISVSAPSQPLSEDRRDQAAEHLAGFHILLRLSRIRPESTHFSPRLS